MIRLCKNILTSTLFLVFLCSPIFAEDSLKVEEAMTEQERKSIGVEALSDTQKQAFEKWLVRWTETVLERAPTYHKKGSIDLWVKSWQQTPQAEITTAVAKVRNEGKALELKDGSYWSVSPLYTNVTKTWKKEEPIKIHSSENAFWPYWAHNIARNQQVAITTYQYQQREEKPKKPKEAGFEDESPVEEVSEDREILKLQDGTQWKISLLDKFRLAKWRKGDRIRITGGQSGFFKYLLENIDTKTKVRANPTDEPRRQRKAHREATREEKKIENMVITKIMEEGEMIELANGSQWTISTIHRYLTRNWLRGDRVSIDSSRGIYWPYWIYNITQNEKVAAQKAKEASPIGERDEPDPETLKDAARLEEKITNLGTITLEDGTKWKIKQTYLFNSRIKRWEIGDRIRVKESDDLLYKYILENLDSGEEVLANPFRQEGRQTPTIKTPKPYQ